MAKKDYNQDEGVKETDKVLAQNEKEIAKVYKQAEEEVQAKLDKYLADFKRKDEKKREQLASGEITKDEYDKWRVGQIAIGQRWEEMKQTISEDYANAAGIAKSVTYGHMPEVYAINHNYGTFQVEKGSNINTSYTMYNKDTVENLFKDGTFYPSPGKKVTKEINEGKQTAWDKKQVQSAMLQGILQGESVDKIAKRVAKTVGEKDKKAAIRNARTMTTCVQNKGRLDSYKRAETMGIEVMNEWIACLDDRTRHEHRLLDGQKVKVGEKFKVDGEEIEYPGDPSASGFMVYNCRCCLAPYIPGVSKDMNYSSDLSDRYSKLGDMSYDEWKGDKSSGDNGDSRETSKEGYTKDNSSNDNQSKKIEIPSEVKTKVDEFEKKYMNAKTEHYMAIDKDGNTIFESDTRGKRNVSVPKTVDERMEGGYSVHNHPAEATFSVEDIRNYERYGEHGIVCDLAGNEYILLNTNPVSVDEQLKNINTEEEYDKLMPFTTACEKKFNEIDEEVTKARREYTKQLMNEEPDRGKRREKLSKWMAENNAEKKKTEWLEENSDKYGFVFVRSKVKR